MKKGGIGINIIEVECRLQYIASSILMLALVRKIILQELSLGEIDNGKVGGHAGQAEPDLKLSRI